MDTRNKQIAKNEVFFREVNERVEEVTTALVYGDDGSRLAEFVCECGRLDCTDKIEMTLIQYEQVRSDPRRFAVLPRHEDTDTVRIVERYPAFLVVEKLEEAGEIAEEHDPRT